MNKGQTEGLPHRVTPETNSRNVRRNSAGEVNNRASLSQSNSEGKILPHYLRTSTGSCHDFCKYGRKHTFESKGRKPTFTVYSGGDTSSEKGLVKTPSITEKKKISAKQKAAAHGLYDRPRTSDKKALSPKTVKPIRESEIKGQNTAYHGTCGLTEASEIMCNFPPPSKELEPLEGFRIVKQGDLEKIDLCYGTEATSQEIPAFLKKTVVSRDSVTGDKRKTSAKKNHLFLEPASAGQRNGSAKRLSSAIPKIEQKAPLPIKKVISPAKPTVTKQVAPSSGNRLDASAIPALPGKSNITSLKAGSQLKPATGTSSRNVGRKMVSNVNQSKLGGEKTLRSDSSSPQPPVNHASKSASPLKHAKKVEEAKLKNEKIREKTLYIIGTEPTDNVNIGSSQSKSRSCRSSSSSSLLSSSSSVSFHEEEYHQGSESSFSDEGDLVSDDGGDRTNIAAQNADKRNQRQVATVHSESKDQTPYKLTFRRGKILNPQSDSGVTRPLRFRQGRRMPDSQSGKGEMGMQNFKMEELTSGESNDPDPESQTVLLKHQDVQDKKDAVGLFNHVIEETASKLVETRKSKVKALVSAFETVISLQERKPATSV